MALQPKVNYPGKIDTTDPNYPEGKAQNVTAPGDGTGTPLEEAWVNDVFGLQQKLLDASGIVPSGNPDNISNSDYFDALVKLFQRATVYNDTGVANAYVLGTASGATVEAYYDGLIVKFIAGASNTGASTAKVGALAVTTLTLAGGGALPSNSIVGGAYVEAIYRTAGPRFELVAPAIPSGVITLWSGAISAIPLGYNLCDGTSGTPDLTDRFVIHADADALGTHNVGDLLTGTGAADGHTLTTAQMPIHKHALLSNAGLGVLDQSGPDAVGFGAGTGAGDTENEGGGGSHPHVITDYKPKAYALAYIMKL